MLFETSGNQGEWLRGMFPRTAGPFSLDKKGISTGSGWDT